MHSNRFCLSDTEPSHEIPDAEENRLAKYSLLSFMAEATGFLLLREGVRNTLTRSKQ